MPTLPANFNTGHVNFHADTLSGDVVAAMVGSVSFTADVPWVVDPSAAITFYPVVRTVLLDATGSLSVDLAAGGDTDVTPTGWTYTVTENFPGGRPPYHVLVSPGDVIDLSLVVTVDDSDGTPNFVGPPGSATNWRGTWDVTATYVLNDGVYYNGSSYRAATGIASGRSAPSASLTTPWFPVALAGTSTGSTISVLEKTWYVSKAAYANDANDGLTWGAPKATIAGAVAAMNTANGPGKIVLGYGTHTISAADTNGNGVTLLRGGSIIEGINYGTTKVAIATTVSWGIVAVAAQCAVRNLQVEVVSGGTVTYGVGVSTLTTTGSSESCWFENVYVQQTSGTLANGFSVGQPDLAGGGVDIAETNFISCQTRLASNAGFRLGNGTSGNILGTNMVSCTFGHAQYGVYSASTGFVWSGGAGSDSSVADFFMSSASTGVVTIDGLRSENSAALFSSTSGTTSTTVSLSNIAFRGAALTSTGNVINHGLGGSLILDNVSVTASASVTPYVSLNTGGKLVVTARGVQTSAALNQLFVVSATQDVKILSEAYTQLSATGSTPVVMTTLGPTRLGQINVSGVGGAMTATINGTSRSVAGPIELQRVSTASAVVINGVTDIAEITLAANATSCTVTPGALNIGRLITISWVQDATGGRTYVWPTICKFAGGVAPTASTAALASDSLTFYYNGTDLVQTNQISQGPAGPTGPQGPTGPAGAIGRTALTDGATISTDASGGAEFSVTIAGNRTFANPTNAIDGLRIIYRIKQDGTGSRTVTWGSAFRFSNGVPPTLSTGAALTDYVGFMYSSTDSKWDCLAFSAGF